jgi:two-component system response regulator NreC
VSGDQDVVSFADPRGGSGGSHQGEHCIVPAAFLQCTRLGVHGAVLYRRLADGRSRNPAHAPEPPEIRAFRTHDHCNARPDGVIRTLLVDDHQIVRSGVRRVLEATGRFDIVGEASGVAEALARTRALRPEVVVLDLGLRDGSGLDVIAEVRELGARVVVLSMQDEPAYARKAFELGAQGYVIKDAADEELAAAIDVVLDDRIYVHPEMAARLVMREPEDDLTERERQILRLIALGYTNQEIAGQLYLSVRTIEAHRRHILDKLRLTTRAELVRYALERRIVDIGSI